MGNAAPGASPPSASSASGHSDATAPGIRPLAHPNDDAQLHSDHLEWLRTPLHLYDETLVEDRVASLTVIAPAAGPSTPHAPPVLTRSSARLDGTHGVTSPRNAPSPPPLPTAAPPPPPTQHRRDASVASALSPTLPHAGPLHHLLLSLSELIESTTLPHTSTTVGIYSPGRTLGASGSGEGGRAGAAGVPSRLLFRRDASNWDSVTQFPELQVHAPATDFVQVRTSAPLHLYVYQG